MNYKYIVKDFFSLMYNSHVIKYRFSIPKSSGISKGSVNRMWSKLNRGAP